ncbi:hypothetical protein TNCV_4169781 [Trichonephila clavipes]|nr:hypothetical protein TNCV_4169781 [Trichonephila clavipes]
MFQHEPSHGNYIKLVCIHGSENERLNINVVLFGYTRAFGDGSRHLILAQVTRTASELAPPLVTTTPVGAFDRFNEHRSPTRQVLSGTELELVTSQPPSDTLPTSLPRPLLTLVH